MNQCPQCGFRLNSAINYKSIDEMPHCTRCDGPNVLEYYDVTMLKLRCERGHFIKWVSPTEAHLKLLETQTSKPRTSEEFLKSHGFNIIGPDEC